MFEDENEEGLTEEEALACKEKKRVYAAMMKARALRKAAAAAKRMTFKYCPQFP